MFKNIGSDSLVVISAEQVILLPSPVGRHQKYIIISFLFTKNILVIINRVTSKAIIIKFTSEQQSEDNSYFILQM